MDAAFLGAAVPVAFLVAAIAMSCDRLSEVIERDLSRPRMYERLRKNCCCERRWMMGGGGRAGQVCAMRGDALVLYAGVRVPASL